MWLPLDICGFLVYIEGEGIIVVTLKFLQISDKKNTYNKAGHFRHMQGKRLVEYKPGSIKKTAEDNHSKHCPICNDGDQQTPIY